MEMFVADLDADLGPVAVRLAGVAGFLAHELAWLAGRGVDPRGLLGLDRAAYTRLALCRAPRPGRWVADVSAIAEYVGADRVQLAALLLDVPASRLQRRLPGRPGTEASPTVA